MKSFFIQIKKVFEKKVIKIEKRVRFVASALVLGAVLFLSTFFLFEKALIFIAVFIMLGYFVTYFSILEGIEKIEWLTLFIMPIILTVSFYLFYFLFPIRWLTRLPLIIFYLISIYAVLLSANIFNVGVEKRLQLYRAAFSINFFLQTIVIFLFSNALFSFRFNFFINVVIVFLLVLLLAFQLIWSVKLDLVIGRKTVIHALFIALALAEITLVGSFVPVKSTIFALFLASSYYSLTGFVYNYLDQRLFKETLREFISVWIVVVFITLLALRW